MDFLKKIFARIKAFPKVIKGLSLKKIIDYFKSHRLLAIIYLIVVVAVIVILFLLISYFRSQQTEIAVSKNDEKSATADVQDLSLTIPENAYPYPKSFTINKIPRDAAYNQYKQLGNFYGDIYELSPNDGRNDLALEPMTYTYRIPNEFYFGDEYFNFELLYIENKENPVVKVFSGGEIIKTENNRPILWAKGFHGSLVGLRVNNPVKQSLGLKKLIDKPDNLKPDLLLVPGIDINFQGFLPNTISNTNPQGNNLWEVTFEDRSIWLYDYPLTETKSANYVREAQNFFNDISKTSYIRLEAKKLANNLLESKQEYDIIAHGIGGIIARYAVENYPITNIRKVVLISVPNTGTNIVNPSFLNLLYGKDTQVLSQIYGLDADTIRYLTRNNLGYLENVNVFYTDILPFAEVIKTLKNSLRNDISYFFIGGNQPDFDAELEDSQFAKFYPENTSGKGDGIVSVYSAIYPSLEEAENTKANVLSKIVPYSFSDIFLQKQTLQLIHSYLEEGIEVVEIPDYQDDTFREWLFDNSDSTKTYPSDESENDLLESTITINPTTLTQEESEKVPNNLPTQTDNIQDLDNWKKETLPKEDEKEETTETQSMENNIPKEEINGQTDKTSNNRSEDNNLEKTISIIESFKSSESIDPIQQNNEAVNGSTVMEIFTPNSSKWNTNVFPDTFVNIQNMIIYDLTKHKFPFDSSPYGIETVGDSVYIFDNLGMSLFKNGTFERISDKRVNAFFTDSRKLYVVQDNILTEYLNGEPSKMSYVMFEAPILSFAFTDSNQYYLLSQNGLTFETASKSFKLNGHYGQILLYGVYPYIITDAGVYLFNGKECELIYEPYNADIQLESGIINNNSLYLLASDYSLRAISLDGEKMLLDTTHNTGGIKILKTPERIIIVGRKKFNIIDYSYKKPEGAFFGIPSTDRVLDANIFEGNLLVLVREGDSTFLKKMAIIE